MGEAMRCNQVVWQSFPVNKKTRSQLLGQRPCVLWFTGLSGSGKSTIAGAVESMLAERLLHTYLMDGDNVRHGLCGDLGFSDADRAENIRRVGEIASLMIDAGLIVLTAFISPFCSNRNMVRARFEEGDFIEIHIDTPLSICESRDSKGLYKKARAGEISNFTGIDSPYEAPETPEIHIQNYNISVQMAAEQVIDYLSQNGYF